ncbi:MAG: DUF2911 domain-containing protein [Gemmatimonadaceae bacterium]
MRPSSRLLPALHSVVLLAALAAPMSADAQTRRSQRAAVMQMVGQTRIEITYSRPVARGRTLFGALVPWNRVWNPGADTATAISVSTPVLVNDQRLPAGAYSLWAIPGQERWTIIFHRRTPVWHIPYPGDGEVALRVDAVPERGSHLETLTYYFPVVEGLTATLRLHWGETIVPLAIRVE